MTSEPVVALPGNTSDLVNVLLACIRTERKGRLALVGGAVRDALLHQVNREPWQGLLDLDFVFEGSCFDLVQRLQQMLGRERLSHLQLHQNFGTAELRIDGFSIDLARARTEIYPAPGLNPLVEPDSLEKDLARRDFTVNAMAVVLQPDGRRLLLDPHGGQEHLVKRQLAFLHEGSVKDDPTRVIRAARYGARLGFRLAPQALSQVASTLTEWPWTWRHGDPVAAVPPALGTRLRMELDLLLEREPWPEALGLLQEWNAMPLLDPWLQRDSRLKRRLGWAVRLGLPAMAAFVAAASDPVALARRLQIPEQQQRWLEELIELRSWLLQEVISHPWVEWSALDWSQRIEAGRWSAEAVALAVLDNPPFRRSLLLWWGRWRHVLSPISARELMAKGLRPGPELGEALRQARAQLLARMR